jgi:SAM-dependent methyltransferase
MGDFREATRDSYDVLAPGYEDMFPDWELNPIDGAGYAAFADLVRAGGGGRVADVGCAFGWLTELLHGLGLDAYGIDLSPGMVRQAQRPYPYLGFEVGDMLDLDVPDGGLGGLMASYSIIHIPWDLRPRLFAEFHRALKPGGTVMLGFQIGDEHVHRDLAGGRQVDLDWYRQRPEDVEKLLTEAGFTVKATIVRQPEGREKTPHGHVLAQKAQK